LFLIQKEVSNMSSRISATVFSRAFAVAAAVWLAGCAAVPDNRPPEEIVRARATERVAAMVKQDLGALYAMTTPSFRKLNSLEAFKSKFGTGAFWIKGEVVDVKCQEQRCTVDLSVTLKPLVPGRIGANITTQFQEPWLLEDGKWWLYQGV
jgi:hypothetical protein